jgi:acyl dehydratase
VSVLSLREQGCWIGSGRRLSTESRGAASVKERAAVVQEGQKFEMERCFTTQDVASYVSLCGDTNPIHTCDSAAQSAGFQGRVVQGILYAGLFPAIIGSHFVS